MSKRLSEEHKAAIKAGLASSMFPVGRPPVPWPDRFWAKVDKNGPYIPKLRSKCWIWTGGIACGYGVFTPNGEFRNTNGGRTCKAHRFIYERMVGPVPEGLELDHLCLHKNCVNYERHLEPVTKSVNIKRARKAQRLEEVKSTI